MIKINLLPIRAAKKKETAQQQIFILVFSVAVSAAIVLVFFSIIQARISSTKNEIANSEKELTALKSKIGEIDNIKKLQADVKKKLDVLNRLRKERMGPAIRLSKMSESIPEKVWLTKYAESGDSLSIGGIAYNEDLIAEFIRNLTETKEFANIELLVSEQVDVGGVKAKRFDISCILAPKTEEPKPASPVKK